MDRTKLNLLIIAICGVAISTMALYLQASSMDLEKYSFLEYLKNDISIPAWWQSVGLPLFIGIIFIVLAVTGIKFCLSSKNVIKLLVFTFGVSVLAVPFSTIPGVLGIVTSATCLISQVKYENKHNEANSVDAKKRRG